MASEFLQRLFAKKKLPLSLEEGALASSLWWSPRAAGGDSSVSLRLLVYREASGKTRKLYFDSATTNRRKVDGDGKKSVDKDVVLQAGYEYKYGKSRKDVKALGEMVYGNLPASGRSVGFKLHFLEDPDQQMWSTTFAPETLASKNASFGSSVGSNLSSSSFGRSSEEAALLDNGNCSSFPFLIDLDGATVTPGGGGGGASSSGRLLVKKDSLDSCSSPYADSGVYSSLGSACDEGHHAAVPPSSSPSQNGRNQLDVRWMCRIDKSQHNSPPHSPSRSSATPSASRSRDLLQVNGASSRKVRGGQHSSRAVIGLAVILATEPGKGHLLSSYSPFVSEVHDKLRAACLEALTDKARFIHILFESWLESVSDLADLMSVERLSDTAWHLVTKETSLLSARTSAAELLASEFVLLQQEWDTKDSSFFFSTFLSLFLTHHLGWVRTTTGDEDDVSPLPHDPGEMEFACLHGMVGHPLRASRSLLLGPPSMSESLRRMVFVLSYFLRSPAVAAVAEQDLEDEEDEGDFEIVVEPLKEEEEEVQTLDDLTDRAPGAATSAGEVKAANPVVFTLGEQDSEGRVEQRDCDEDEGCEVEHRVDEEDERVTGCDGAKNPVESVEDEAKKCDVIVRKKKTAAPSLRDQALQSLVCHGASRLLPSAVLQGCLTQQRIHQDEVGRRLRPWLGGASFLHDDSREVQECLLLVGDMGAGEVFLLSSSAMKERKTMAATGRKGSTAAGLPVFPAPAVVSLLDAVADAKRMGADKVLDVLECRLRSLVLRSRLLAGFLLQEPLVDMDRIVTQLGLEPDDVPLLLSVASAHTPEVTAKYGVSFR